MKTITPNNGFTLLELLVVVAVIALLAGFLLPYSHPHANRRAARITCINNLKQVGIGFHLYAADGASFSEFQASKGVWQYFQTAGREIGSPKVLLCPADKKRKKAKSFPFDFEYPATPNSFAHPMYQNASLSFFFNPDAAKEKPDTILSGDRNISTNQTILSGMLLVETNTPVNWTDDLHKSAGNILLADGSVQQVNNLKLREYVRTGTNGTQRLLIP